MKIKKILASAMVAMVAISVLTSFSVFADTVTQKSENYCYSVNNAEIKATDSNAFTFAEANQLSSNLRQSIADATADNTGCKVTLHIRYKSFDTVSDPQMLLAVNYKNIQNFYQIVELDDSTVTFDWDTILSKANWESRQGVISDITIGTNEDIVITGIDVYVPQKSVVDLSAGAGCKDLATIVE